jgi:cell division protein FtsW (lipid II flippase)
VQGRQTPPDESRQKLVIPSARFSGRIAPYAKETVRAGISYLKAGSVVVLPAFIVLAGMISILLIPLDVSRPEWKDLWVGVAFALLMMLAYGTMRLFRPKGDTVVLGLVSMLMSLGILLLWRLEPSVQEGAPGKQILWTVGSIVAFALVLVAPVNMNSWRSYKYTLALLGLALVLATLLFGTELGPQRVKQWISIGDINLQPGEFLKLVMVLFAAGYLDDKRYLLSSSLRLGPLKLPPIPYLLPLAVIWVIALVLFVLQRDLGSALLFLGVFLAMLYVASGKSIYIPVGIGALAFGIWVLSLVRPETLQVAVNRVAVWVDPWPTSDFSGYQIVQALYALANGGIMGQGLGYGQPASIPARHTDMPLIVLGEDLGLAGSLGLLIIYSILLYKGLQIAMEGRTAFRQLLAVGITTSIGLQLIINVGGATKLIPLTGVTLPFVSYGGSSLLVSWAMVGLLIRISAEKTAEDEAGGLLARWLKRRAIRRRKRRGGRVPYDWAAHSRNRSYSGK